jgi:hypothetical protein
MKVNAVIFCLVLLSCNQHANNNLQTKIDSLQSVIDKSLQARTWRIHEQHPGASCETVVRRPKQKLGACRFSR